MTLESSIAFVTSIVALIGLIGGMIVTAIATRYFVKTAFYNEYEKFEWVNIVIACFCAGLFVLFTLGTIWWIAMMTGIIHYDWQTGQTMTTEIVVSK